MVLCQFRLSALLCLHVQVILDLGHVTFGNILDWSCDEVDLHAEPVEMEDDDDGIHVVCIIMDSSQHVIKPHGPT